MKKNIIDWLPIKKQQLYNFLIINQGLSSYRMAEIFGISITTMQENLFYLEKKGLITIPKNKKGDNVFSKIKINK